jgi:hypothetical protein
MDNNLDFNKYEMTFVGNSPINFKNIIYKKPMTSIELAKELRLHHIFISASKFEPCSNALLEAMHCGLPALAFKNGGNPEIVGRGGELFSNNDEIINKLSKLTVNYKYYKNNIILPDITLIANKYYDFMTKIFNFVIKINNNSKIVTKNDITEFKKLLINHKLETKSILRNKYFYYIKKLVFKEKHFLTKDRHKPGNYISMNQIKIFLNQIDNSIPEFLNTLQYKDENNQEVFLFCLTGITPAGKQIRLGPLTFAIKLFYILNKVNKNKQNQWLSYIKDFQVDKSRTNQYERNAFIDKTLIEKFELLFFHT